MTERIRKTPIREALAAMDTVWSDAQQRLDAMGPERALDRMPGAIRFNSSHPFRDKLHIEGMLEGLKFALTGHSEAVEYWLRRAESIKAGDIEIPTQQTLRSPSKLQSILIGLTHGLSLREAWGIFRSRPVSERE